MLSVYEPMLYQWNFEQSRFGSINIKCIKRSSSIVYNLVLYQYFTVVNGNMCYKLNAIVPWTNKRFLVTVERVFAKKYRRNMCWYWDKKQHCANSLSDDNLLIFFSIAIFYRIEYTCITYCIYQRCNNNKRQWFSAFSKIFTLGFGFQTQTTALSIVNMLTFFHGTYHFIRSNETQLRVVRTFKAYNVGKDVFEFILRVTFHSFYRIARFAYTATSSIIQMKFSFSQLHIAHFVYLCGFRYAK